MNVPLSWLKTFFDEATLARALGAHPGEREIDTLVGLLDGLGLSVERSFELPAAPDGVIVAEVVSVTPLEGSDHLLLTEVETGSGHVQVVTGAPNAVAGLRTALAQPGSMLPAIGLSVERREMAGAVSEGVLCSPRELGLYEHGGGLIAFADDVAVGTELASVWPAETVIELELTPNRADAFSLLGVARDLAAKLGIPYEHPAEGLAQGDPALDDGLSVQIEDVEGCPRFTGRRIDGLTIAPSPVWLQRRLAALGLRPRNNVVDVTNYVTFELGHPSHAYDLNALHDGTIVVRRARAGETLTTLGEETLELGPEDLVIATPAGEGTKPIGLAGVIGGLHDSVTPGTKSVALELAHWNPVRIRKTAKRHGITTDAHTRFERGVDPNLPPLASARAAQLIADLAGGSVHPGLTEVGGDVVTATVPFRPSRVEFLTTLEVPLDVQERYLEALGCAVERGGDDVWHVTVPSWRFDLAIEDDLVEEVARLYGYDKIGLSVPVMDFVPEGKDTTHRGLRTLLVGLGFQEALTYTFSSDDELARSAAPAASVRLSSPPSSERSVLRTALYPGLLAAARTNRGDALSLFEIGRVFGEEEEERLAFLMRGVWQDGVWQASRDTDFYVFKGLLEKLAATLGVTLSLTPKSFAPLHPGVSAALLWDGDEIGFCGQLHPQVASAYEIGPTYLAEVRLPLLGHAVTFQDFSRQPFAERDLAIIAPQDVTYAELAELVRAQAGGRLESFWPFDVYAGTPIPEGERSVALRLRFRDPSRALRDDEVDGYMENVIAAVLDRGYAIRDR